ncbi:hypothetical protein B0A49_10839 [Cryomyces minteri]|uniref:F-box domain-containing protein n=1 Tax=Cryomyces minteri TaxID=331657 RepID=A0A4U0W1L5_9PEZI|nr:hypothetical protein B0A49_10839 [Cryomyces minteri]
MAKRQREDVQGKGRFAKRLRPLPVDRLSLLSDELLLRILSFVSVPTLITCQRLSHKFYAVAGDSQLWKALYYNHWVRPRASRLPGIRDPGMSAENLFYSSKVSKWLDEETLVKRGTETNWKRQFKLRHNWSRGSCVRLHSGIIFTVDSRDGLRAWSTKEERKLLASVVLADSDDIPGFPSPTSLSVDLHDSKSNIRRVAVGFQDGRFSVYELRADQSRFLQLYTHAPSSNGMVATMACASPYLITMTATQLLSLYKFDDEEPQEKLHTPPTYSLSTPTLLAFLSKKKPRLCLTYELYSQLNFKMEYGAQTGGGRGCYNCGDTTHQARDCPTKGNPTCYNCGEQGHLSRECQNPQKEKPCYRCGQTGHMSRECPNEAAGGAAGGMGGSGGQECYKCGKVGHIARNCTQGGGYGQGGYGGGYGGGAGAGAGGYGGGQRGGQTCYSCGGYGHMSRDCTQGQKCYNCGEVGHLSRDCPSETSNERVCYKCKQPGHVQASCPN